MTKRTKKILIISLALTILVMLCCLASCGQAAVKTVSVKGETYYMVGEEYKDGDTKLTVVYTDGTRESVNVTEAMMKGFDTTIAGKKTVYIEYKGKVATLEITVSELYASQISVTSESVNRYFTEDTYTDGDAQIVVSYTDGTTETVDVTESMISGFSTAVEGNVDVTVQYARLTTTYSVNVRHPLVTKASINANTRKIYEVGSQFGLAIVDVEYENGKSATINVNSAGVEGFDSTTAGEKTVQVTHRNWSDSLNITVVKQIQSLSLDQTVVYYGQDEEFRGDLLKVENKDGTSEDVDVTADMLTDFDTSTLGRHVVKLAYGTREVTFELYVVRRLSTEINQPQKLQVEDESSVYLSGLTNYSMVNETTSSGRTGSQGAEGTKYSNGAEGYSIYNSVGDVAGTLYLRFYVEKMGAYHLGMRGQAMGRRGIDDLADLSQAVEMTVNGASATISGKLNKASTLGRAGYDNHNWTELENFSGTLYLQAGMNEIALTKSGSAPFPGIDYFTVTAEATYTDVSIEVTGTEEFNLGVAYNNEWTLTIKDGGEVVGTIPVSASMMQGFDTSTVGERSVSITYLWQTVTKTINVVNKPHTVTLVGGTFTATGFTTAQLYNGDAVPAITWSVPEEDIWCYYVDGKAYSQYTGATMGFADMTIEAVTTIKGSAVGFFTQSNHRIMQNSGINAAGTGASFGNDFSTKTVTAADVYGTKDGGSYNLTATQTGYLKGVTWLGQQNFIKSTGTEIYVTFTNNNDVTLEDVYFVMGNTAGDVIYFGDVAAGETVKGMMVIYTANGQGNGTGWFRPSICYANEMTTTQFTISVYANHVS